MSGVITLTSADVSGGSPPPHALSRTQQEHFVARLKEDFGFLPIPWIRAFDDWHSWSDAGSTLPGPRTAFGTTADRKGGRDLPLFWSELDLRAHRVMARWLCDSNDFAIGFSGRLTDYHIRKGFGWQVCKKGQKKTAYPTTQSSSDPVVQKGQNILDSWRDATCWPLRSREAFKRWRRDGEVFGRFFFLGWGKLPAFRFVEPEQIGSPNGSTDGPQSFGIETELEDVETKLAYHVWSMEHTGYGEWIEAEFIVHTRANVDSTIKRGIPDFYPVYQKLEKVRELLDTILITAVRQAAVAWREKYKTATASQIAAVMPSGPMANLNPPDATSLPWYTPRPGNRMPPGTVQKAEGDREWQDGPVASGIGNFLEAEQAALRACCVRWGLPEYTGSGDASNNNFASSLVAGSPFAVAVEGSQYEWGCTWERPIALKVLDFAVEAGLLSAAERAHLDVEMTEPAVVTPKPLEDTQRRQTLNAAGILSPQTWQLEEQLDPQHEAENWKEWRPPQQQGQQGQPQPPGGDGQPPGNPPDVGAQDQGGGQQGDTDSLLAQLFSESDQTATTTTGGFSGDKTDKLGRKYHYINGKKVAGTHEEAGTKPQGKPEWTKHFNVKKDVPQEVRKASTDWQGKLTAEEKKAVVNYIDPEAGDPKLHSLVLNKAIREGTATPEQQAAHKHIMSAIAKAPPLPAGTKTYRGITAPDGAAGVEKILSDLAAKKEAGQSLKLDSLTSTSLSPSYVGSEFAGSDTSIVFEIDSDRGVYIDPLSPLGEHESEILRPPDEYEVVNIHSGPFGSKKHSKTGEVTTGPVQHVVTLRRKSAAKESRTVESWLLEHGFTGIDKRGVKWVDGKEVPKDAPTSQKQPSLFDLINTGQAKGNDGQANKDDARAAVDYSGPTVKERQPSKEMQSAQGMRDVARRRRVLRAVKNEGELSEAIDGHNLPDSEPADVIHILDPAGKPVTDPAHIRTALKLRAQAVEALANPDQHSPGQIEAYKRILSQPAHFFEVKTLLTSKNDVVRMSPAAMERKHRWMRKYGITFHTVAFDDRRGSKHSGHRVYVIANAFGSTVRLNQMQKVASLSAVLAHVSKKAGET